MARPFDNSKNPQYANILKELNSLSALKLQVYLMRNIKNMSNNEVAEKLGIDPSTVSRYNTQMSQTEFVKSMREDIIQLRPLIFEALIDNLKKKKEQTLNACLKGMGIYEERLGFGKGDETASLSDEDLRRRIVGWLFPGEKKEIEKTSGDTLDTPDLPPKVGGRCEDNEKVDSEHTQEEEIAPEPSNEAISKPEGINIEDEQ